MTTSLAAPPIPQPQLHSDLEYQAIIALARAVPKGGVIVETGTGPGGTSNLLRTHADPSVTIATIDICQRYSEARVALADKNIQFIDGTSEAAATEWTAPIDFLFIDSGHRVFDVHTDVKAWFPHLKPGGRVAFHDYDTQVGGGIHQTGVRVTVDTLLRLGVLTEVEQYLSLLTATVPSPDAVPTPQDYAETLRLTGQKATQILDYYTPSLVDWLVNPTGSSLRAIVENGPLLEVTHRHHEGHPILNRLNQLMFCYLFDHWMKHQNAKAYALTAVEGLSRYQEMMRWIDAERHISYPHFCTREVALGIGAYPQSLDYYRMTTVEEISRFVTMEQTRVLMLSYVTNPIFERILKGY